MSEHETLKGSSAQTTTDDGLKKDSGYFFTTMDASFETLTTETDPSQESDMNDFYEHSFSSLEDNVSSQDTDSLPTSSASFVTDSEDSIISEDVSSLSLSKKEQTRRRLASCHLSKLDQIPNAGYLHSITPQTMTANLIVGIISLPAPRTITTRRYNQRIQVVEMLVGDHTRAGFGITIWLPNLHIRELRDSSHEVLEFKVAHLRPRDIILARNVALGSFRGKVRGYSLRNPPTTLDLLYRDVVDVYDVKGAYNAQEVGGDHGDLNVITKVKQVKEWVTDFVGNGLARAQGSSRSLTDEHSRRRMQPLDVLPPDTQ